MTNQDFKRSSVCFSTFALSALLPLSGFAQTITTNPAASSDAVVQVQGEKRTDSLRLNTMPTDPVLIAADSSELGPTPNMTGIGSKSNSVQKKALINANDTDGMVSSHISLGYLNGEAKETVYQDTDSRTKLSELDWRLDQVLMLGAGVSVKPMSWLRFNADLWLKVNDGSGSMDDYDWMYSTDEWSHWSHSNVSVTKGILFDLNTEMAFLKLEQSSFFAILGYKHDNWEWESKGGNGIYSVHSFRDYAFTLPDEKVITYEQTFDVPYLGVGFRANMDPVALSGRFLGSAWVRGNDKDQHHLRNLEFKEDFSSGKMYGLEVACSYNFSPNLATTLAYQYQKFENTRADMTIKDLDTNAQISIKDNAGIGNTTSLVSLALVYTF
jgi:plasminogen activator